MKSAKRIGILGGSFDPIHLGHLLSAQQVATWLSLEKINLMPAHIPPHKNGTQANSKHRVAMVSLACQVMPCFQLDSRELQRNTPSYTIDTLKEIRNEQPNSQLFFLMGMDSLLTLTSWHQWQELLNLTNLVVSERPGYNLSAANSEVKRLIKQHKVNTPAELNKPCGHIIFSNIHLQNISATELRQQLTTEQKHMPLSSPYLKQWLLPEVIDYIKQHKLYQ